MKHLNMAKVRKSIDLNADPIFVDSTSRTYDSAAHTKPMQGEADEPADLTAQLAGMKAKQAELMTVVNDAPHTALCALWDHLPCDCWKRQVGEKKS